MPQQAAVRSADLTGSFGVDAHINYTDSQYVNINLALSALQYLGINHVRDGAPNPNADRVGQVHLENAADAGVKFTFVVNDPDPLLVVQRIHAFVEAHPGSVVGIEGPNEVNNWPVTYAGQTGTAGAQAYQKALFDAVNADALLKNIPVLGFTDYPSHASDSDWNNTHPYPKNGDQPYDTIVQNLSAQMAVDPGKPFAITEMGYHTSLTAETAGGWEGVSEAAQAKLLLNALMDAAALGSRSTSIYQLLDAYADTVGSDQEKHFGLFRLDGSAKPAADAIHNLTAILTDAGGSAASFNAGTLNYAIDGLSGSGHSFLTQKSDGAFQIIAWNEPDIWNETTNTQIAAANVPVTVNLGQSFGTIQIFDPLQGSTAIQTLHDTSSVSLNLVDHPLIIQVSGTPTAGASGSGASGSGAPAASASPSGQVAESTPAAQVAEGGPAAQHADGNLAAQGSGGGSVAQATESTPVAPSSDSHPQAHADDSGAGGTHAPEAGPTLPAAGPALPALGSSFTHGSFDAAFYLFNNPDVAKAAQGSGDPAAFAHMHYETFGWHEGRDSNAYFSTAGYIAANPDVAAAGINPLTHYDQYGWKEGRDPSSAFDTDAYLAANPDVAAAHVDPLLHYLQFGQHEGRHLA